MAEKNVIVTGLKSLASGIPLAVMAVVLLSACAQQPVGSDVEQVPEPAADTPPESPQSEVIDTDADSDVTSESEQPEAPTTATDSRESAQPDRARPDAEPQPISLAPVPDPAAAAAESRFSLVEPAQIADTRSGLVWAACNVGQTWTLPKGCAGSAEAMSWSSAQETVSTWNSDRQFGHSSWRVPSADELRTLLNCSSANACESIEGPLYNEALWTATQPLHYWVSPNPDGDTQALSFRYGSLSHWPGDALFAVRFVRDGPP